LRSRRCCVPRQQRPAAALRWAFSSPQWSSRLRDPTVAIAPCGSRPPFSGAEAAVHLNGNRFASMGLASWRARYYLSYPWPRSASRRTSSIVVIVLSADAEASAIPCLLTRCSDRRGRTAGAALTVAGGLSSGASGRCFSSLRGDRPSPSGARDRSPEIARAELADDARRRPSGSASP
jgi:hypothetical protein